jgi:hypothetical protein
MLNGPPADATTASVRKGGDGIGLEIIAKLATVLEVEPAELLRVSVPKDDLGRDKLSR